MEGWRCLKTDRPIIAETVMTIIGDDGTKQSTDFIYTEYYGDESAHPRLHEETYLETTCLDMYLMPLQINGKETLVATDGTNFIPVNYGFTTKPSETYAVLRNPEKHHDTFTETLPLMRPNELKEADERLKEWRDRYKKERKQPYMLEEFLHKMSTDKAEDSRSEKLDSTGNQRLKTGSPVSRYITPRQRSASGTETERISVQQYNGHWNEQRNRMILSGHSSDKTITVLPVKELQKSQDIYLNYTLNLSLTQESRLKKYSRDQFLEQSGKFYKEIIIKPLQLENAGTNTRKPGTENMDTGKEPTVIGVNSSVTAQLTKQNNANDTLTLTMQTTDIDSEKKPFNNVTVINLPAERFNTHVHKNEILLSDKENKYFTILNTLISG